MKELIESRQKLFRETFELENEGCSECGGFELIDKTQVRYPKGKYHCEYDLSKIESFHSETTRLMVEEFKRILEAERLTWAKESIGAKAVESVQKALLQSLTE